MKNVNTKFENLIRKLNYKQIQMTTLDVAKIEAWCKQRMPLVVDELIAEGWDLSNDDTWLTNTFCDHTIYWYGKKVNVFITPSLTDFNLFNKVINYKKFREFRNVFNIDMQCAILVHPVIFLGFQDLDTIYLNFDFDKGYCAIDMSHFDEEDELDDNVTEEYSWLLYDSSNTDEWDAEQIAKAYSQSIYH